MSIEIQQLTASTSPVESDRLDMPTALEEPTATIDLVTSEQERETPQSSEHRGEPFQGTTEGEEGATQKEPPPLPCTLKCTLKLQDLLSVLAIVKKAALNPNKALMPILANVQIAMRPSTVEGVPSQVVFTCTDREIFISRPCEAEVEQEGVFTVPVLLLEMCAKNLISAKKAVKKKKGASEEAALVTLHVAEPPMLKMSSTSVKRTFDLRGLYADTFPEWGEMILHEQAPFAVATDDLRQAMKDVLFAAATDDSRPVLESICFRIEEDQVTFVGADAYRLAVRHLPLNSPPVENRETHLVVPLRTARLLMEIMPQQRHALVMWSKDGAWALLQAGDVQIATRLIMGTYPDYKQIVPKSFKTVATVEREDLAGIVKALTPIARDSSFIMRVRYNREGWMEFTAHSEELGAFFDEREGLPVTGEEDGSIILNCTYLLDVLNTIQADTLTLSFNGEGHPCVIHRAESEEVQHIIMAMSTNN